jgi:hypothetical protein
MTMQRHSDIVTQNSETFIKGASLFRLRRLWMCRAGAKERKKEREREEESGGGGEGTITFLGRT